MIKIFCTFKNYQCQFIHGVYNEWKTLDYKNTKNFGLVVYLVALSNISDLCQNWSRNFQYFYLVDNGVISENSEIDCDNIQIVLENSEWRLDIPKLSTICNGSKSMIFFYCKFFFLYYCDLQSAKFDLRGFLAANTSALIEGWLYNIVLFFNNNKCFHFPTQAI